MAASNTEVMMMVVAVVICVLAVVCVGVYFLDRSAGRGTR